MSLVTEHNERFTDTASGGASSRDPYSLDGLPQGDAGELLEFAANVGALK